MKAKRITSILLIAAMLGGCATVPPAEYRPIIDTQGVDLAQYETDLWQCQSYAQQIDRERSTANAAVAGAIAGAIFTVALGALLGLRGHDLGQVAAGGALGGATGSAARAAAETGRTQVDIIRNCMAGRGYKVLA